MEPVETSKLESSGSINISEHDSDLRDRLNITFYTKLVLATLLWKIYYIIIKKLTNSTLKKYSDSSKKLEQAYAQVLSMTVSAIALVICSIYHVPLFLQNYKNPSSIFNLEIDPAGKYLLMTLFGYFLHDTIWCIQNGWHEITNYCHHLLSISFTFGMLVFNNTQIETFIPCFMSEISTIPLNIRWFQRMFHGSSSLTMDLIFMGTFFFGRIIMASYFTYWLAITEGPKMVRYCCYGMDFVNVFWFWKMIKMLQRRKKTE